MTSADAGTSCEVPAEEHWEIHVFFGVSSGDPYFVNQGTTPVEYRMYPFEGPLEFQTAWST